MLNPSPSPLIDPTIPIVNQAPFYAKPHNGLLLSLEKQKPLFSSKYILALP